ncbi:hypothetical protein TNCV_1779641 [Trichonephila clavipes]|nr:hypothetical protein TNCV_1779641 [Trichonephila clavipes]
MRQQCRTSLVQLLNSLSANAKFFFQRAPSHVNVCGNGFAYGLAREGSHKDSWWLPCFFRNCSPCQTRYQFFLEAGPIHKLYEENHPGATLLETGSRRDETTLARLRSGHTRA